MVDVLKEGDAAPDFELPDENGKMHRLSEYRSKKVVLYFYPKDDTPGCTREACDFSEAIDELTKRNVVVIGISADDGASHGRFKERYGLRVVLLADTKLDAINKYGARRQDVVGKFLPIAARMTFVIDENGKIMKVFPKVNPEGHAKEILAVL